MSTVTFAILMMAAAVLWLLSIFLEVYLIGRSDKLGLILPIASLLIPIGTFLYLITGPGLTENSGWYILGSLLPTVGYYIIYRFAVQKKHELRKGNRNR